MGEQREILAVGDGFPGWWGYYPSAASLNPEVARVTFKKGRSLIPFREPGIIFGGSRCYLHGNKKGSTWLLFGNAHTLPEESIEIDGTMVPERHDLPGYKWVKVEVVPAPDL